MKVNTVQATFNSGQLSDRLAAREDVRAYYAGAAEMTNVFPVRQGGFDQRPDLEFVSRLSGCLGRVTGGILGSTPNGGDAARVLDDDPATVLTTTTAIGTTDEYVVVSVDLGAPVAVAAVDVVDGAVSAGAAEFKLQSSPDDVTWSDYGAAFNLVTEDRSRRRTLPATARYWRLIRIGTDDLGAAVASLNGLRFWRETGQPSNCRLVPFKFSNAEKYICAVTGNQLMVFRDGVQVGSAYIPHLSGDLPVIRWVQTLDVLILLHHDHGPWRLFRQGGDDEWDFRAQPFFNIPQHDFGNSPGGVDEVQRLDFFGGWGNSHTFKLRLEDEETNSLSYNSSAAVLGPTIENALRALPNTSGDGITVTYVAGTNQKFDVSFSGQDGSRDWPDIEVVEAGNSLSVSTTTEGEAAGEDIMSDVRGWPGCAVFYQGRFYLGGLKSLPDTIMASRTGDFFNFEDQTTRADTAIVAAADTDAVAEIFDLVAGDHLQVLTSDGAFFQTGEPAQPDNFALKRTGIEGVKQDSRVVQVDGATLYVHRSGNQLMEMIFQITRDGYEQTDISALTDVLVQPVDAAVQAADSTERTSLVYLVNGDGSLAVLSTMRAQEITSFSRAATDGVFEAVGVDDLGPAYFAVRRVVDGESRLYLERFADGHFVDSAVKKTLDPASATIDGLDHLEGCTVEIWADGNPAGTAVVSGGAVTLSVAVSEVSVGLPWRPLVRTMPFRLADGPRSLHGKKVRVARAMVDVSDTGALAIGMNGRTPQDVPLVRMADRQIADTTNDHLVTGPVRISGGRGWTREGQLVITRNQPGPLSLRGISYEVAF